MANIRLTDTQYGAGEVRHLALSLSDAYAELMALKKLQFPAWTDDSPADIGNYLLWLTAVLQKFGIDYTNRVVQNCYVGTAIDRQSMQRLLALINYAMSAAVPASVVVTFTLEEGYSEFTIPAGTQVATEETPDSDQIIFEVAEDTLVTAGQSSIDITCVQGETVEQEVLGSSDGTADQRFKLTRPEVIELSETVQVLSDTWQTWLRKTDFIDSGSNDLHYRVEYDSSGYAYIVFGDGSNGKAPVAGSNNVRCSYRVGGGEEGNVPANTVSELISSISEVTAVNNSAAASGGAEKESIEHARKYGPASLGIIERAVTQSDYKYLAEQFVSGQFGGIAKAAAIVTALTVKMMIVPTSGGTPTQGLKDALLEYLNDKKEVCTSLEIADPVYKIIDITMDLYVEKNYSQTLVENNVRSALANFLSPVFQDQDGLYIHEFGRDIYMSDLYNIIESIQGVHHSDISLPAANVTVDDDEIAKMGTLSITVYQSG